MFARQMYLPNVGVYGIIPDKRSIYEPRFVGKNAKSLVLFVLIFAMVYNIEAVAKPSLRVVWNM